MLNEPILRFYKKSKNMLLVVFDEEFKTGLLGFEIGPEYIAKMLAAGLPSMSN